MEELTEFLQPVVGTLHKASFLPCEQEEHGDLTTNIAFLLAKEQKRAPMAIGQDIAVHLKQHPLVATATAVGGYVNLTLVPSVWVQMLHTILKQGSTYGKSNTFDGAPINIEYVSANPTGPLHAGHARIAIVGDVLANVLEATGYTVTREYYINDAGNQITILARSVQAHLISLTEGTEVTLEEGLYPGAYVRDVAQTLKEKHPNIDQNDLSAIGRFAIHYLMTEIQKELALLDIRFDHMISEHRLQKEGFVTDAIDILRTQDLVYEGTLEKPKAHTEHIWEEHPLLLFRSTAFGDDQDRPLTKSNGEWTYFAGETGYRLEQYKRGFRTLLSVWGADHASHVLRTVAAVKALTNNQATLDVVLCQIVNFLDKGVPIKMSKRAGTFVTLRDVLEHIDKDALRFMIISKKAETHFDFDFESAKEHTKENPVFYVQYAHARCCSVIRAAGDLMPEELSCLDPSLFSPAQQHLIKLMADWPRQVLLAAQHKEPHRITTYLYRLATAFHALWQQGKTDATMRFIQPDNQTITHTHLSIIHALRITISAGLRLLGMHPREEMR